MLDELTQTELDELKNLEESLWNNEQRADAQYMASIFSLGFTSFNKSGSIQSRQLSLEAMKTPVEATLPLKNFKITQVDINTALITYENEIGSSGQKKDKTLRSSIWSRINTRWKIRFHQATLITS